MTINRLRIAIIGAGPGGLTMGALLHQQGIPFTIFELRSRPTENELQRPAGSLDLHEGSGLAAIRKLGLFDKFRTMNDDCTQVFKLADKEGRIIHKEEDENSVAGQQRPEIARNKLNQLLYDRLPPAAVQWEHRLGSAQRCNTEGRGEIVLDFGSTSGKKTFDLVIGADGAWSRIRPLLTEVKPKFANQHFITTSIRNITSKHPHLAQLVGSGSFTALGDKHGIVSQRAANDTARIYTLIHTNDEKWAAKHDLQNKTAAEVKSILLEGDSAPLRNFGPVLKELISVSCDDETAVDPQAPLENRPLHTLYDTSEGHPWTHQPGITLLGDAAHLMPPNGEGVNMAMQDALQLTQAIVAAHQTSSGGQTSLQEALSPLLKDYEADMFSRATEIAKETEQLLQAMYGSNNGAQDMLKFFKEVLLAAHAPEAARKPVEE